MHPLLGVIAGIIGGVLSGALDDIGINDDFIKELGDILEPGNSALFMLVHKVIPDKVIEELQLFNCRLLQTSLLKADDESLKAALEKEKEVKATSVE